MPVTWSTFKLITLCIAMGVACAAQVDAQPALGKHSLQHAQDVACR